LIEPHRRTMNVVLLLESLRERDLTQENTIFFI